MYIYNEGHVVLGSPSSKVEQPSWDDKHSTFFASGGWQSLTHFLFCIQKFKLVVSWTWTCPMCKLSKGAENLHDARFIFIGYNYITWSLANCSNLGFILFKWIQIIQGQMNILFKYLSFIEKIWFSWSKGWSQLTV